jgi:hypothetical protein
MSFVNENVFNAVSDDDAMLVKIPRGAQALHYSWSRDSGGNEVGNILPIAKENPSQTLVQSTQVYPPPSPTLLPRSPGSLLPRVVWVHLHGCVSCADWTISSRSHARKQASH